ncbi:glycosyltransferase family 87 protein [Accumulibacter sp.]|uniref:glycosyltransferase family 87 protein n=1 Tax=Accumulibacter sp. TaxID=2053492 RepID=UPI00262D4EBB|nr:glycosyltransferase family 87 protein [Accumulibacter sp.]
MTDVERRWNWMAWGLWLITIAVIAAMVIGSPLERSMTPGYHHAVANWWARQPVYTGPTGFNYLPIFLSLFGLFAGLPIVAGELLWRAVAVVGLYAGLWRYCGVLAVGDRQRAFAVITALSLPLCFSALRNGQSSAQLAACLVLAAWCLHRQRCWWATLWLSLALVCKPLGLPAIGLAVMAFPGLWWRMAIGVAVVLVGPFLFVPPDYATGLYVDFANNLAQCLDPGGRTFADLNGVLRPFGLTLDGMPSLLVRVAAGLAMAAACWFTRRLACQTDRALLWLGFTGIYIMLFTPMNEANSYVMLAPALALWAWRYLEQGATRTFRVFVALCVTMMFLPDLVGLAIGKQGGHEFGKFWNPLMTLAFLAILAWRMRCSYRELQGRGTHGEQAPIWNLAR